VCSFVLDCCLLFTNADAVFRNYCPVLLRDRSLAAELPDDVGAP
jgi:nicotinamidase-related amidase